MPSHSLPQIIDALLRLPLLEPGEIKQVIDGLADPQASAQEMLRRGWITQKQFSALFPEPEEPPKPRETIVLGCGDDDVPPDLDSDAWELPVAAMFPEPEEPPKPRETIVLGCGDDDVPPGLDSDDWELPVTEEETGEAGTVPLLAEARAEIASPPEAVEESRPLAEAAVAAHFEWNALTPETQGNRQENSTDRRLRLLTAWAGKGLLMWLLFLGSFFVGHRFFGATPQADAGPQRRPVAFKDAKAVKELKRIRIPDQPNRAVAANLARDEAPPLPGPAMADEPPPVPLPVIISDPPAARPSSPREAPPAEPAQAQMVPQPLPSFSPGLGRSTLGRGTMRIPPTVYPTYVSHSRSVGHTSGHRTGSR